MNIARHLLIGRPRTIGDLAESLNLPRRTIEAAVQQARLDGVPVISGSEGVWLAQSPQEARGAAARLRSRAIHQLDAVAALERWAEREEQSGQTSWLDAA